MSDRRGDERVGSLLDPALADLTERITQSLQAGEVIDLDEYTLLYPKWSGSIRRLLPTLRMLVELGQRVAPRCGIE
jgi:hypothetical protein